MIAVRMRVKVSSSQRTLIIKKVKSKMMKDGDKSSRV